MYLCIDLKSFYASVECVERGLDPMKADLVVADPARGAGAICLAVSPSLKAKGVKNRCRRYEIPEAFDYIVAPPRMKLYMRYSARVFGVFLRYISEEDIHVYSVDECFIDATHYTAMYGRDEKGIAQMLMQAVLEETGLWATAGVGTNLFLAKVALDLIAKHEKDRIGFLDEDRFKERLWHHRPITDFWNIGPGTAKKLWEIGIDDLYGVAHCREDCLYRRFGVNAELLIDHANGRESCTIAAIHAYKPKSTSLSGSQILFSDYEYDDARLVLREMAENIVLELISRGLACDTVGVSVGYSKDVLPPAGTRKKLGRITNSASALQKALDDCFVAAADPNTPIRRLAVVLAGLREEKERTFDFFTDLAAEERELKLQKTVIGLKTRYGKNSVLKARDFEEKATARARNGMIGGHHAGEVI